MFWAWPSTVDGAMKGLLNRRLGPLGVLVMVLIGAAAAYGIAQVVPKKGDDGGADGDAHADGHRVHARAEHVR